MSEMTITVPQVPASVNTYVRHAKGGHYKARPALVFENALAYAAHGKQIIGEHFVVAVDVYLAPKQHPDVDNLAKQCLDGLAAAGVLRNKKGKALTDNRVARLEIEKHDGDRSNPRTEIRVRSL